MCRDPAPIPFTENWSYELRLPRDPRGPRIARVTLRAVLACHGLGELAERAEVLASELTTNSLRHTSGPASVTLAWLHPALRVTVWDASPKLPGPPGTDPASDSDGGRGLFLLEALADRWGGCAIDDGPWGPGGKSMWFELLVHDREPPATPAAAVAA
ncbi:ATP-binding protein [Streptomyces sp. B6B3]|uniref:ATP-binding protein n=1 Tax=Streptomyces sp. B6B3 TaxID=3153570 RepID=UPI00325F23A8